ncbi:hypothetical protein [Streptomyces caniscabiei]|uniref:Transposase n=1 Tax=Streptomyces caniscabiei TaxID=2746961 RepID=A0ABU4MPP4_9ACTN|nr:hypothetical protein [Streptomyces caniscabiei]MBE4735738.1 hypothetical protein [Streptomyces caniscabiei]MBE4758351.1 hypothetical protein [Streptomyces caniscabiei]MBE4788442.1 hypothetical protein [Streptomyces caniscabiei]MDX2986544.1 hypothetical protein [Streptomyces caniscabiei]MDX3039421.1 hypothetical protein [Streptomyces caniscabiei]
MKPTESLPDGIVSDITIYPVGLLRDLTLFVHNPDRPTARRALRASLRREWDRIKARKWRAVKSYFNGYLAEHATLGTRCGTGWTRGRAYRDLARHLHRDPRDGA